VTDRRRRTNFLPLGREAITVLSRDSGVKAAVLWTLVRLAALADYKTGVVRATMRGLLKGPLSDLRDETFRAHLLALEEAGEIRWVRARNEDGTAEFVILRFDFLTALVSAEGAAVGAAVGASVGAAGNEAAKGPRPAGTPSLEHQEHQDHLDRTSIPTSRSFTAIAEDVLEHAEEILERRDLGMAEQLNNVIDLWEEDVFIVGDRLVSRTAYAVELEGRGNPDQVVADLAYEFGSAVVESWTFDQLRERVRSCAREPLVGASNVRPGEFNQGSVVRSCVAHELPDLSEEALEDLLARVAFYLHRGGPATPGFLDYELEAVVQYVAGSGWPNLEESAA
jgi:hypothetical protein